MEFLITTENDAVTLSVRGELDAKSVPEIRPQLDEIVESKPAQVTMDLTELRLIDSTGVGAIVSLFKRVGANGGRFKLTGVQGQPYAIFQVLRLDRVFQLEG